MSCGPVPKPMTDSQQMQPSQAPSLSEQLPLGSSPEVALEKLDFELHDFVRFAWASDTAREVWQPRLKRIANAWTNLEWLSTLAGIRSCAIMFVRPEDFVDQAAQWLRNGLYCLPLTIHGTAGSYTSRNLPPLLGKPFMYRVVVGDRCDVEKLKYAYDSCDDILIGRLLGYPDCCTLAFRKRWVQEHVEDTTWSAAVMSNGRSTNARTIRLRCLPQNNILWRWMGIRAVPHLPCTFACATSTDIGAEFLRLGRASGYKQEMDWLLEVLSWPLEWSALHAIAEIRTPVLKVSTRTDATALKYVVQIEGSEYPAEGARGLGFPYNGGGASGPVIQITSRSQESRSNGERDAGWYWSDNGFSSIQAMNNAHLDIVNLAGSVLSDCKKVPTNVLDLGCGNGVLLRRVKQVAKSVVPFGVDIRPAPIRNAQRLLAEYSGNFCCGDMFDCEDIWPTGRRYSLVLLMVGRLLDEPTPRAVVLKNQLLSRCDHLLVYAYDDTLALLRKEFPDVVADAGLRLVEWKPGANIGTAKFCS